MKLTIGVLISNRIDTVKKCLESLKPLLDKGIAELICVDTVTGTPGKVSDGSAELAREYTDKVYVFPWINDFSAARNVTLEHATGEWYVFSDDDEWFEDVSELVEFFSGKEYLKYNSASYIIRNYKDKAGSEWADARAVRFVKRTKELRFEGVVHEHYTSIKLPCKELKCFAHHYGYAFENEEQKKAHRERNVRLLKEELQRNPNDLRLYAQMALELASYDNEGALEFIEDALKKFEGAEAEPYFQWMVALKFPLYEAIGKAPEEAEKEFENIRNKMHLSETALLSISYSLTRLWLINNKKNKAPRHIKEYFKNLEILLKNPEMRQLQNTADFEKYLSGDRIGEMKKYEGYCMENNSIWTESGTLKFGERKITLTGTNEEIISQLNEMTFDDFKIAITGIIQETQSCFENPLLNAAIDFFASESQIEYCYLLYKMSETEIKRAVEKGVDGNAIFDLFNECICTERKMYELLFKPEVFTESMIKWMPVDVRYNDILYRFITSEKRNLKMCLEAAKLRTDMANVIKVWLGALK